MAISQLIAVAHCSTRSPSWDDDVWHFPGGESDLRAPYSTTPLHPDSDLNHRNGNRPSSRKTVAEAGGNLTPPCPNRAYNGNNNSDNHNIITETQQSNKTPSWQQQVTPKPNTHSFPRENRSRMTTGSATIWQQYGSHPNPSLSIFRCHLSPRRTNTNTRCLMRAIYGCCWHCIAHRSSRMSVFRYHMCREKTREEHRPAAKRAVNTRKEPVTGHFPHSESKQDRQVHWHGSDQGGMRLPNLLPFGCRPRNWLSGTIGSNTHTAHGGGGTAKNKRPRLRGGFQRADVGEEHRRERKSEWDSDGECTAGHYPASQAI